MPSAAETLARASRVPRAKGGMVVWIRTLTVSNGTKAASAVRCLSSRALGSEGRRTEELGRGRASEVDGVLVLDGVFRAGNVGVLLLEVLVEAVLERALHRVADERRAHTGAVRR